MPTETAAAAVEEKEEGKEGEEEVLSPSGSEGEQAKATFPLTLFTSGPLLDSAACSGPSPFQLILPENVLSDPPRYVSLH